MTRQLSVIDAKTFRDTHENFRRLAAFRHTSLSGDLVLLSGGGPAASYPIVGPLMGFVPPGRPPSSAR